MALRNRTRSTRLLVVILVSVSLLTITVDYRQGDSGPLAAVGSAALAIISPLRLVNMFTENDMSDAVMAAGLIAFPANLGSTMCLQAVQVYINRNVPENEQGGVFGLQQVQENELNLTVILLLGLIGTVTGPQYIFFFAPIVVGAIGLALLYYTFRHTTGKLPHLSESIGFLIEDVPPQELHDAGDDHDPDKFPPER